MEFTNEFTVPVGVDRAFEVLTDLERVAPCLPGATLEEVDGDAYTGRVKVKVGPIAVTYRGTAEIVERDADAKRAVIAAKGKETRGSGTASADVTATLVERTATETAVKVVTDLAITGKPAQFGRGVLADVGTKLISTFAERLEQMLLDDQQEPAEPTGGTDATAASPPAAAAQAAPAEAAEAAAPTGPRRIAPPAQEPEALDLVEIAGGAVGKRLVPVAIGVALLAALVWWLRGR